MHTLTEALARERTREYHLHARRATLTREAAAQRRWHRVSQWAHAAEQRHASRLSELPVH